MHGYKRNLVHSTSFSLMLENLTSLDWLCYTEPVSVSSRRLGYRWQDWLNCHWQLSFVIVIIIKLSLAESLNYTELILLTYSHIFLLWYKMPGQITGFTPSVSFCWKSVSTHRNSYTEFVGWTEGRRTLAKALGLRLVRASNSATRTVDIKLVGSQPVQYM